MPSRCPLSLAVLAWSLSSCDHQVTAAPPIAATAPPSVAPGVLGDPRGTQEALAFEIVEGHIQNRFFRQGPIAAHIVATSGATPRLIFAFPAGDMGVALFLEGASELSVRSKIVPEDHEDGMRGVTVDVEASAPVLGMKEAVLGSIRVVRDYEGTKKLDGALRATARVNGDGVILARATADGGHHVELAIAPVPGSGTKVAFDAMGRITLAAGDGRATALRITALADDPPLTPIPRGRLLRSNAVNDGRTADVLAFLSYREKLLAGSWHFLTYFGRDTLLSVAMLMPVLTPEVTEAALGSVIDRLSDDGQVAHEEEIGEFAVLGNRKEVPPARDVRAPRFDRKMIDGDFLFAPVLARYLLEDPDGRGRAQAFLARRSPSGRPYAEAVLANLDRVLRKARPFANDPGPLTLIAIEANQTAGNWRDSSMGLGGGRYPFDVNVALVPAALRAAAQLYGLAPLAREKSTHVGADDARVLADAWGGTERFFRVELPRAQAVERATTYARELGLDVRDAAAKLPEHAVGFPGLSLDANGAPVPVMHSDDGFLLFFCEPSPARLEDAAERISRPFPLGLRTPVGVVVANAGLSGDAARKRAFAPGRYHGAVVWSWQQALLAAGLRRQLARADLPEATRQALREAERVLWEAIDGAWDMRASELWSFSVEGGRYKAVPFRQETGQEEESNAAQLWSTVYLAVQRE